MLQQYILCAHFDDKAYNTRITNNDFEFAMWTQLVTHSWKQLTNQICKISCGIAVVDVVGRVKHDQFSTIAVIAYTYTPCRIQKHNMYLKTLYIVPLLLVINQPFPASLAYQTHLFKQWQDNRQVSQTSIRCGS